VKHPSGPDRIGSFERLATAPVTGADLPSVCLVTGELVGPFQNGGLGTSMTGLIEFLSAHGADCTVIYTGVVRGNLAEWKEKYAGAGIRLEALAELAPAVVLGPLGRIGWTNAWTLYHYLKDRDFDIIHFNDTMGEGVYCTLAKRHGLAFQNTLLTVALHSPTEWILESNGQIANWAGFCCFTTGERVSIANTDLLWGPSRYLLGWIDNRGYKLPAQTFNQQYIVPSSALFDAGSAKVDALRDEIKPGPQTKPQEIVFFGRLEERKGIRLFTSAITKMGQELADRGVRVTFMGKPSTVNGVDASEFLAARAPNWPFEWKQESGFGQVEAVTYLREKGRFAVMASPVDNSPCTVYEALQFGFPFIAAATGGIPELIHEEDRDKHLFEYKVDALCARIRDVLDTGISRARPAVSVAQNQDRWFGFHQNWREFLPSPVPTPADRKYAVLIDHDTSEALLDGTLSTLRDTFGDDLTNIVVLVREVAGVSEGVLADRKVTIYDDLSDATAQDILDGLESGGADALLAIRSGVWINAKAPKTFSKMIAGPADAYIPMTWVADLEQAYVHLSASAALYFHEAGHDAGGFVTTVDRLRARLGDRIGQLDRTRIYLGMLDELYGANAEVWPIPELLFSVQSGADIIRPERAPVRSAMSFADARHAEVYQMAGIGRHHYQLFYPLTALSAPSAVASGAKEVITKLPFVGDPASRRRLETLVARTFGLRGTCALMRLKSWLRAR